MFCGIPALGACAATFPTLEVPTEPGRVSFVTQPDRAKHRVVEGTSDTTVRAYVKAQTESGQTANKEVPATCTMQSDHVRGQITTPRSVQLPKYDQSGELPERGVPPSIAVTCRDAEGRTGSALLAANPRSVSTATGAGVVGAIVVLGVTAAVAASANWRYDPAVSVVME